MRHFSSAIQAQTWFEQSLHRWKGKTVAMLLPPIGLGLLALVGQLLGAEPNNREALAAITQGLITLLLVAVQFIGFGVGLTCASFHNRVNWFTRDSFAMPGFFAALPMPTGDFVWAKLTSAVRSMTWVCVITLAGCAMMALYAGLFPRWGAQLEQIGAQYGAVAQILLPVLAIFSFVLTSLLVTASACWLALFGRAWNWVNGGIMLIGVASLTTMGALGAAPERFAGLLEVLPTVIQVLAAAKLVVLGVLIHQLRARQLLDTRRILFVGGWWAAAVTTAVPVVLWLRGPGELTIFRAVYELVLLVPVCGVLAAPLALQINRSR